MRQVIFHLYTRPRINLSTAIYQGNMAPVLSINNLYTFSRCPTYFLALVLLTKNVDGSNIIYKHCVWGLVNGYRLFSNFLVCFWNWVLRVFFQHLKC